MATLDEIVSNVRTTLGDPQPQHPRLPLVFKHVLNHTQSIYNHLNNTNKAWTTLEIPLQAQANKSDYTINAQNWGRALLVYTEDQSTPGHWERTVPFFNVQNLNLAYEGPRDGANWFGGFLDGSNHTALGIAFYREPNGQIVKARIRPVPQAPAVYRVIYAVGPWAESAGLDSSPVLAEHHHLIEVRAAISSLPDTKWWIPNGAPGSDEWKSVEAMNAEQRRARLAILGRDAERYTKDFELYVRSLNGARISFRNYSSY
jgi:hypothetical protein